MKFNVLQPWDKSGVLARNNYEKLVPAVKKLLSVAFFFYLISLLRIPFGRLTNRRRSVQTFFSFDKKSILNYGRSAMGMNAMLFYDDQSAKIWQMGFWDDDGFFLFFCAFVLWIVNWNQTFTLSFGALGAIRGLLERLSVCKIKYRVFLAEGRLSR